MDVPSSVPADPQPASTFGLYLILLLCLAVVLCQFGGMFFALGNVCEGKHSRRTRKTDTANDAGVATEFFRRAVQDWESEERWVEDRGEGAHHTAGVNAETAYCEQDAIGKDREGDAEERRLLLSAIRSRTSRA